LISRLPWKTWSTRRAPRLHGFRQQAARLDPCRSRRVKKEHRGQHAGGDSHATGPGDSSKSTSRRRRRFGGQVQVRDAQSFDSIVDWWLKTVPTMGAAGARPHARHRRRAPREGDGNGEGSADGADRHGELKRAAGEQGRRVAPSSSTTRSTRSASARRGWADSPPCST